LVVLASAVVLGFVGFGRGQEPPKTLGAIQKEHELADATARRRAQRAKTAAELKAATDAIWAETKKTAAKAFAWAEEHPDDPEALDAIIWTIHGLANGSYPSYLGEQAKAYRLLAVKGLASEKVAPVCYYAGGESVACPDAKRFLEAALEKSPNRLVQGAACLGLARDYHAAAQFARRVKDDLTRGPLVEHWKGTGVVERAEQIDPDESDRKAAPYYERVVKEFGDLKMPQPYNQVPFAELAGGELYEMQNLGIGKTLPDVEGEDVRGGKIRLADYRGKVVAIDFWATWCGPCMGMIPHHRALVKRMKGKPFALLGVNGDDDRDQAAQVMTAEGMTWHSIWNGGQTGGVVAKFGVRSWPTLYLIDAQGVIRYRNVYFDTLDKAVDKLVAEAAKKK
jgi:thiol-disulfide isomerase/thioredoxin